MGSHNKPIRQALEEVNRDVRNALSQVDADSKDHESLKTVRSMPTRQQHLPNC